MIRLIVTVKDGDAPPVTTERLCSQEELCEFLERPIEKEQPKPRKRTRTRYWQITFIETSERDPVSHRRRKHVYRTLAKATAEPTPQKRKTHRKENEKWQY